MRIKRSASLINHFTRRFGMGVSRRDFLKLSGGTAVAGAIGAGISPQKASAAEKELRIKGLR